MVTGGAGGLRSTHAGIHVYAHVRLRSLALFAEVAPAQAQTARCGWGRGQKRWVLLEGTRASGCQIPLLEGNLSSKVNTASGCQTPLPRSSSAPHPRLSHGTRRAKRIEEHPRLAALHLLQHAPVGARVGRVSRSEAIEGVHAHGKGADGRMSRARVRWKQGWMDGMRCKQGWMDASMWFVSCKHLACELR